MSIEQKRQLSQKRPIMIAWLYANGALSKAAAMDILIGVKNFKPQKAAAFLGVTL